jgi:hypothetical protein
MSVSRSFSGFACAPKKLPDQMIYCKGRMLFGLTPYKNAAEYFSFNVYSAAWQYIVFLLLINL